MASGNRGWRWNVYLQATVYPDWTSPPTTDYKRTLNVGHLFAPLFHQP